jgi:methylmalonyl-CoA mutase cobalamin-binding subunit
MDRDVEVIVICSYDKPFLLALVNLLNNSVVVEPNSTLITFGTQITKQELFEKMGLQ